MKTQVITARQNPGAKPIGLQQLSFGLIPGDFSINNRRKKEKYKARKLAKSQLNETQDTEIIVDLDEHSENTNDEEDRNDHEDQGDNWIDPQDLRLKLSCHTNKWTHPKRQKYPKDLRERLNTPSPRCY